MVLSPCNLQINFQSCYVVQWYGCDKNTDRCQKVDNKDELQEFPRTPNGLKQLPQVKKSDSADDCLDIIGDVKENDTKNNIEYIIKKIKVYSL